MVSEGTNGSNTLFHATLNATLDVVFLTCLTTTMVVINEIHIKYGLS